MHMVCAIDSWSNLKLKWIYIATLEGKVEIKTPGQAWLQDTTEFRLFWSTIMSDGCETLQKHSVSSTNNSVLVLLTHEGIKGHSCKINNEKCMHRAKDASLWES